MVNVIKNIDKTRFHVDVIIKDGDRFDQKMFDELIDIGTNVFLAKGTFINKMKQLKNFFSQHRGEYDVFHINAKYFLRT